jgi:hypothetical protein
VEETLVKYVTLDGETLDLSALPERDVELGADHTASGCLRDGDRR